MEFFMTTLRFGFFVPPALLVISVLYVLVRRALKKFLVHRKTIKMLYDEHSPSTLHSCKLIAEEGATEGLLGSAYFDGSSMFSLLRALFVIVVVSFLAMLSVPQSVTLEGKGPSMFDKVEKRSSSPPGRKSL